MRTPAFPFFTMIRGRWALTDCTLESGCLRVLDKSFRHGFRSDLRAFRSLEVSDDSQHMPEGEVIPIELLAGDAGEMSVEQ